MPLKNQYTGNNRLRIFADIYGENSFVLKTKDVVFARVHKCGKWHVWYYKKHLQKDFNKLRNAIDDVDKKFIDWYQGL